MKLMFTTAISLAPGFSPVLDQCGKNSRFNGFFAMPKAAEAATTTVDCGFTGLKPGANGRKFCAENFASTL